MITEVVLRALVKRVLDGFKRQFRAHGGTVAEFETSVNPGLAEEDDEDVDGHKTFEEYLPSYSERLASTSQQHILQLNDEEERNANAVRGSPGYLDDPKEDIHDLTPEEPD